MRLLNKNITIKISPLENILIDNKSHYIIRNIFYFNIYFLNIKLKLILNYLFLYFYIFIFIKQIIKQIL